MKILYKDKTNGIAGARLLFHGNLPPDTTDSTGAIAARMILLRTTDIKPEVEIPEFHKVLLKEAKGILNRWVRAYARLVSRKRFEPPSYSSRAVLQATTESNSVSAWVSAICEPTTDLSGGMPSSDLFQSYREWCEANKMFTYSSVQWGKMLTAMDYPAKSKRIAGGRVVNYRQLRPVNQVANVRF